VAKLTGELFLSLIAKQGRKVSVLISDTGLISGKCRNKNTLTTDWFWPRIYPAHGYTWSLLLRRLFRTLTLHPSLPLSHSASAVSVLLAYSSATPLWVVWEYTYISILYIVFEALGWWVLQHLDDECWKVLCTMGSQVVWKDQDQWVVMIVVSLVVGWWQSTGRGALSRLMILSMFLEVAQPLLWCD